MQQLPQGSFVDIDPSLAWMPLDGLIQVWAAFGNGACDGPQMATALQATSQAFAALAEECLAFRQYTMICARRQQSLPSLDRKRTIDEGEQTETILTRQGSVIEALQRAATHWLEVTDLLERYATQWCQEDEALLHDPRVLLMHAHSQRLRAWTIAQHLLQEEMTGYRKHYSIITDLLDDRSQDDMGTERRKRR